MEIKLELVLLNDWAVYTRLALLYPVGINLFVSAIRESNFAASQRVLFAAFLYKIIRH